MKKIVKFNKNLFKKTETPLYVPHYQIMDNITSFNNLLKDLKKIKKNFGNYLSRPVLLLHNDEIPPKTSRCTSEIALLCADKIQYSTTYFKNFESDSPILITVLEIEKIAIDVMINKVMWIIELFNFIKHQKWTLDIIKKNKQEMPSKLSDFIDSKKTGILKTNLRKIIFNIQKYFSSLNFIDDHMNISGRVILRFSNVNTREEFIRKNKKISNNSFVGNDKVITNSKNITDHTNIITMQRDYDLQMEINKITQKNSDNYFFENISSDAPIVGVLDGSISSNSPLRNIISVTNYLNIDEKKNMHGEAVASIVAAGPSMNKYDDFVQELNVHLFEVYSDGISVTKLLERIENAIKLNYKKIKVWNMSMNFIYQKAADAGIIHEFSARLDEMQQKFNIIIIQSAGNRNSQLNYENDSILAPADSVYSLTVNATHSLENNMPASYALKGYGTFLTKKPDLSIFGGDSGTEISVFQDGMLIKTCGTSFAAPLVARQVAHLIYYEGYSILEAKALLINSAYLNTKNKNDEFGWGVLPLQISKTLETNDNEIRFIISDKIKSTNAAFHNLHIPLEFSKFNYSMTITNVCDPKIDSNYGAEYIRANVPIKIGYNKMNKYEKFDFTSIRNKVQHYFKIREKQLMKFYGKWKSTNVISDIVKRSRDATKYKDFSIKSKIDKRLSLIKEEFSINFTVVVTLSNILNNDNFQEFILKNELNINNFNELHQEQDIDEIQLSGNITLK